MDYGQTKTTNPQSDNLFASGLTTGSGIENESINSDVENSLNSSSQSWNQTPDISEMPPEIDHQSIGNLALNSNLPETDSPEEGIKIIDLEPQNTPSGDIEPKKLTIEAKERLSPKEVDQINAVIQDFKSDKKSPDTFYEEARNTMENYIGSYGDKANWKGKAA